MRIIMFIIAYLLSSCITVVSYPKRKASVPQEVQPYVEVFKVEYAKFYNSKTYYTSNLISKISSLNIKIEPLKTPASYGEGKKLLAVCDYDVYGQPIVILDKKSWEDASSVGKEVIIFHELGHCVLGQEHRTFETDFDVRIKGSIMDRFILDENDYKFYKPYYLQEFFSARRGAYGECNLIK